MNEDDVVVLLLRGIKALAMSPRRMFENNTADVNRVLTLGYIGALASSALEDPPRNRVYEPLLLDQINEAVKNQNEDAAKLAIDHLLLGMVSHVWDVQVTLTKRSGVT